MPERFAIAAYADPNRENAARFAAYSGASPDGYTTDPDALLGREDVEAVLVSVPIPLNLPLTRACLEAGKHVICEKPAGANLDQGREFLALAARHPDRTVLIAENHFYRDDLRLARSLLDAGAIGRVHLLTWRQISRAVPQPGDFQSTPWRRHPQYRGGMHLDGGVHHVAQLRLLGGDVQQLHGLTQDANAAMGGPSDLALNLLFVSQAIGTYTAAHPEIRVPEEDQAMRLYGTEGVMVVDKERVEVHRPDGSSEAHRLEGSDGGYYNEFRDFYDGVVHGASVLGTVAQSVHNLWVFARALDSAEGSGAVELADVPGGLSERGVPLWRPHGAEGLFDGLPVRVARGERPPPPA
jgi:predicted dehydrogenase